MQSKGPQRSLLSLLLLALAALPAFAQDEEEEDDPQARAEYLEKIDFDGFAKSFREEYCGRNSNCNFDEIVDRYYAKIDLGAFHVVYPGLFLGQRKEVEKLPVALGAMVDLQDVLASWTVLDSAKLESLEADGATLRDWILSWRAPDLARVERADDKDLIVAMQAPPEVAEAARRFEERMRDGQTLGLSLQLGEACQVVLCPTRRNYIEVVAICGKESPEFQEQNWRKGLDQWTQCWRDWTLILSMEYAPWSGFDEDFERGMDMVRFDKDGLRMMMVQQTGQALLHNMIARKAPWHEEDGLARNLVIGVCGRINTLDNERGITTSGGASEPYEVFVPGGNPGGGVLTGLPAPGANVIQENQWRKGHGEDHFVSNLSKGQRYGGKKAAKDRDNPLRDDPVAHFMLEGDKGAKHVISAPFLGPHANDNPYPPDDFMHDYRQFFESYMTCFLYWLRGNGGATPEESRTKYAELLRGMGGLRYGGTDFDALVEKVYGIPISGKDGSTDNLEWRFLHWLEAEG